MSVNVEIMNITTSQAFSVVRFCLHYAIPVSVFVYCYGRIFHTIRRQSKVLATHMVHIPVSTMAGTSRSQNTGQIQQQATGASAGAKLSRTEMNVLKTMITVIICFMMFFSFLDIYNLLQLLGVNMHSCTSMQHNSHLCRVQK